MASTTQFPVANTIEKLTADEAASPPIVGLYIGLGADGFYHFFDDRAEAEALGALAHMVLGGDGFYHLNDDGAGERRVAYFPGIGRAVL